MGNEVARVAVVVSHPIQHFCPQYSSWAKMPGVDLRVFFASRRGLDSYHDRKFGRNVRWNLDLDFDHVFLPGAEGRVVSSSLDCHEVEDGLEEYNPDYVVAYGYSQKLQRRVIRWARKHEKQLLMIADSELRQERSSLKSLIKRAVLPRIYYCVDAFLTVGDANEEYYRKYGVCDRKLVRSFFPIDFRAFDEQKIAGRDAARSAVRVKHSIPEGNIIVLMVGKLIDRKRQIDLVKAAVNLRSQNIGATVVLAGTGDQEQAIRNFARSESFDDLVLLGFVDPQDLISYYLASDIYVHCSSVEPHSLAISEAIYSGLPVVVSDRCGSYGPSDDVRVGLNGYVYKCGDAGELAAQLTRLARSPDLLEKMGKESELIAKANQLLAHGKALLQAIELLSSK